VNILSLFTSNLLNSKKEHFAIQPIDIKIDTLRGCSNTTSPNNFIESSLYSNISSIDYVDRVHILANSSSWTNQIETEKLQEPFLS